MREFTDAQRRYEYAEKEFVAAKLDLHGKRELKEQLTEHLLLIIQEVRAGRRRVTAAAAAGGADGMAPRAQNEARKAKKLDELMRRMEMSAVEADGLVARQVRACVRACLLAGVPFAALSYAPPNTSPYSSLPSAWGLMNRA